MIIIHKDTRQEILLRNVVVTTMLRMLIVRVTIHHGSCSFVNILYINKWI